MIAFASNLTMSTVGMTASVASAVSSSTPSATASSSSATSSQQQQLGSGTLLGSMEKVCACCCRGGAAKQAPGNESLKPLASLFSFHGGGAEYICVDCRAFLVKLVPLRPSPDAFPPLDAPLFRRVKYTVPELQGMIVANFVAEQKQLAQRLVPFMSGVGYDLALVHQDATSKQAISVLYPEAFVAIVDVSGYTKLSERLVNELGEFALDHASGAEALVLDGLNKYFTKLIDCIHSSSGDVVKFAGDALIVLWTRPEERAGAIYCALEISHHLKHQVLTGGVNHELTAHVGMACGPVVAMSVGEGRREIILTGTALKVAGEALDLATSQTCVVSSAMFNKHLSDICVGVVAMPKVHYKKKNEIVQH